MVCDVRRLAEEQRARKLMRAELLEYEAELAEMLARSLEVSGELRPLEMRTKSGTKPISFVEDEDGDRFVLKRTSPELFAAEELAFDVRRLGGRPAVPVVAQGGEVLKPFVDGIGSLPPDPAEWSELQREVIVREHPWEWLLMNLDTHRDQYVRVGDREYPLNIDWDRSFDRADGRAELTRFTAHRAFTPPARNLLYDAFVRDRVKLHFAGMFEEITKIESIPEDAMRAKLERFAKARFDSIDEAERFVDMSLERKRDLRSDFQHLVRDLVAERSARKGRRLTTSPKRTRVAANTGRGALLRATGVVHRSIVADAMRGLSRRLNAKRLEPPRSGEG